MTETPDFRLGDVWRRTLTHGEGTTSTLTGRVTELDRDFVKLGRTWCHVGDGDTWDLVSRAPEPPLTDAELDRIAAYYAHSSFRDVPRLVAEVRSLREERDKLARVFERSAEPDPLAAEVRRYRDALAEMTAQRDRYLKHSELANSLGWRISELAGAVPPGADAIPYVEGEDMRRLNVIGSTRDRAVALLREMCEQRDEVGYALPPVPEGKMKATIRQAREFLAEVDR